MQARRLHRQIGWVAAFVAIAWAVTGFLHPVMNWTAPRAAIQMPPARPLALPPGGLAAPGEALAAAGLAASPHVRLVQVGGEPYWFAADPASARRAVVSAVTGVPSPEAEAAHAEALARHYAALPDTAIASVRPVDAFSTNYPSINRLLPVWAVQFDTPDGLTLYVDTGMDRLAAVTNGPRRVLLAVFQNVHTLSFLSFAEPLRVAVLAFLILTVVATTFIGAALLLKARGKGLRRAHTLAAWLALPIILAYTLSGLFHLVMTNDLNPRGLPVPDAFPLAALDLPALDTPVLNSLIATAGPDGAPLWRIETVSGIRYAGQPEPHDDAARARTLAGASAEAPVSLINRFGDGYSFADKRLPVMRVEAADGPVFVDVREGVIAAIPRLSAAGRAETWCFNNLHKWEFLKPVGTKNRDIATMLATVLILLTAALGLALQLRRRRSVQ
ncbi:hypothetical protein [Hyphomonas sp.]|uniref:hypothetical protein n=1 Tax=Hyphomonas sp. TaxID=87 RepID=UPI00391B3CB5